MLYNKEIIVHQSDYLTQVIVLPGKMEKPRNVKV